MANQRILYSEEMVGYGHPTKADTLNRLFMVKHDEAGGHTDRAAFGANTDITSLAGNITNATKTMFSAYKSATTENVTGDGTAYTLIFDTEVFDQGSNYNNASGVFTAAVTAKYDLKAAVLILGLTATTTRDFYITTSNRVYYFQLDYAVTAGQLDFFLACLADMDAGDTAYVTIKMTATGGKVADAYGGATLFTYFSGYLVC